MSGEKWLQDRLPTQGWRAVKRRDVTQKIYISLDGRSLKGRQAVHQSRLDQETLKGAKEITSPPRVGRSLLHGRSSSQGGTQWEQSSEGRLPTRTPEISSWSLPIGVEKQYLKKGITSLYQWQYECLTVEGVERDNRNLVYSVPTSAGKSLVADILAFLCLSKTQRKALYVLPFVSLVTEKAADMKKLMRDTVWNVREYHSGAPQNPNPPLEDEDVAVCVIEKANSIINSLLEKGLINQLGIVVVDELHLLGDPSRGYLVEILLTKLRFVVPNVQIVGLSATIPNLRDIANWLGAAVYESHYRPVPLAEYVLSDHLLISRDKEKVVPYPALEKNVKNQVVVLCQESVDNGQPVLVFCPSKRFCQTTSSRLAQNITEKVSPEIGARRTELCEDIIKSGVGGYDQDLLDCIQSGVAFHHSGLSAQEKAVVEHGFRTGVLNILVATSTVAAGVNLPAGRVIFRTVKMGPKFLSKAEYLQMSGRAGRAGLAERGEAIIIAENAKDASTAWKLLESEVGSVLSALCAHDDNLSRLLVELASLRIVDSESAFLQLLKFSFLFSSKTVDEITSAVRGVLQSLADDGFLLDEGDGFKPSDLCHATFASALSPKDAIVLKAKLDACRRGVVLDSDLHLLHMCTPVYQTDKVDWKRFEKIFSSKRKDDSFNRVCEKLGVDEGFLTNASAYPDRAGKASPKTLEVHKHFYSTMILCDIANEYSIGHVADKFGVERGVVQSLQDIAGAFMSMTETFCHYMDYWDLEVLIHGLRMRMSFGVREELVELMKIDSLASRAARALYNNGLKSPTDVAVASIDKLHRCLAGVPPFLPRGGAIPSAMSEQMKMLKTRATTLVTEELNHLIGAL